MLWLTVIAALWFHPLLPQDTSIPEHPDWMLERMSRDGRAGIQGNVFTGNPTVVAAFATWCEPCAREVPELNRLHREHPELQVVGISVDDGPPGKVRSWLRRHGAKYPVFLPNPDVLAGRSPLGNVEDLPVLAFFQANGVRSRRLLGSVPDRLVARCLSEIGITTHHTP